MIYRYYVELILQTCVACCEANNNETDSYAELHVGVPVKSRDNWSYIQSNAEGYFTPTPWIAIWRTDLQRFCQLQPKTDL